MYVARFERATESAVESLAMRNLPFQELADAIRNRMNEMVRSFRRHETNTLCVSRENSKSAKYSTVCSREFFLVQRRFGFQTDIQLFSVNRSRI